MGGGRAIAAAIGGTGSEEGRRTPVGPGDRAARWTPGAPSAGGWCSFLELRDPVQPETRLD